MGDARPGLGQASDLPIGQVDRMGEHRPRPEGARPVVDVDVVARLREQARDLRDLARVLGHVRLPPAPVERASDADSREQLRRARDREPRRDRVAKAPVGGAMPARDQIAPTRAATARGSSSGSIVGSYVTRSIITLPRIARIPCASAARKATSIAAS